MILVCVYKFFIGLLLYKLKNIFISNVIILVFIEVVGIGVFINFEVNIVFKLDFLRFWFGKI